MFHDICLTNQGSVTLYKFRNVKPSQTNSYILPWSGKT
uniref:Uncharacterized protein n=1 Tax=Arundo donax TaxID=35708 RepID=A0A0A9U2P6_ARUDO